ncbi:hypothetical protein Sango_2438300 [Sesamum angolense]|uniref:Uncharacterized protein n=1 Tax=Sesamum angolense TaxID=2727404 RepID=A0AAE1W7T5_9LAMI|nr:hypothetical protein Sango_2438300 [Sesamum angolense]
MPLVFKLAEQFQSDEEVEKRALTMHLQDAKNIIGQTPVNRGGGWMKVEIGQFYIQEGDYGEVEGRLLETYHGKSGLIVEGIEFRLVFNKILHVGVGVRVG